MGCVQTRPRWRKQKLISKHKAEGKPAPLRGDTACTVAAGALPRQTVLDSLKTNVPGVPASATLACRERHTPSPERRVPTQTS